jgi:hypothetical protein
MIDNTHVVVLRGTGREMVPVPEMAAFAERFSFQFVAHERGDANRSARVERPFWFIENNFLAGRTFSNWPDLNEQARKWCDRVNSIQDLGELAKNGYVPAFYMAAIYTGLGDKDDAFQWLENAAEEHSGGLAFLGVDPAADSLRSDPRFQALLRRMGLPE